MNYSNLPVHIEKETGANHLITSSINNYLPAQNISIDYAAQNDALRLLGVDIDQNDQFTHGAALQAKISFNSYINTETTGALNTILNSSGNDSYCIRLGKNTYNDCYLNDYNVSVEPFKPAVLSANYIVNNAPKVNLNTDDYIVQTIPAATNYLLRSQDLIYTYYITTKGNIDFFPVTDPTGGSQAYQFSGSSANTTTYDYTIDNSESYTWATITGTATKLTTLQTNNDTSVQVSFTASKTFSMNGRNFSSVLISNNGIINFDTFGGRGFSNYNNHNFPITDADISLSSTQRFIAAYWKDFSASTGSIWYRQDADRFIIEYNGVSLGTGQPQTFQIHLFFATGIIEIKYKTVSSNLSPNANVGLQWSSSLYKNYDLSLINLNKILRFTQSNTTIYQYTNFIYKNQITPLKRRTFSIYLKRISGTGNIKYTLNGGTTWTTFAITSSWARYSFPANSDTQQIGIQIETFGDIIYVYGPQLEDGSYSTDYMPTLASTVTRDASTVNIPINTIYPSINLSSQFANTMINGNTCSISSTTGIVSDIQNSIRYSVNCGRTPIYNVGTTNANSFILDTVEKQMDISSTNLASFINYTGSKLSSDLNLTLKDYQNITGSVLAMRSGANLYAQQSNIQEGDTLVTQVSIKEIIV
jgi:hypothetical protein